MWLGRVGTGAVQERSSRENIQFDILSEKLYFKFYSCFLEQVESHIFAVGGCRSDGTVLYSIERYNTETDQWSSVGLMQVF